MFPAGAKDFSVLQTAHTGSAQCSLLFVGYQGYSDQEAKRYCHKAQR
jgi:hypothetical protein